MYFRYQLIPKRNELTVGCLRRSVCGVFADEDAKSIGAALPGHRPQFRNCAACRRQKGVSNTPFLLLPEARSKFWTRNFSAGQGPTTQAGNNRSQNPRQSTSSPFRHHRSLPQTVEQSYFWRYGCRINRHNAQTQSASTVGPIPSSSEVCGLPKSATNGFF